MTGQIRFTNDIVEGQGITAKLYDQPIKLNFETTSRDPDYIVDININGDWQLDQLSSELDNPLQDFYHGKTSWQSQLKLIFDPTGYQIRGHLASDLVGTSIDLPAPLAKSATQKMPLQVEFIGDHKQASLGITLADKAEFWSGFDFNKQSGIDHYDLLIGRLLKPGDQLNQQQGHIQIDLAKAQLSDWLPVIHAFTEAQPVDKPESNATNHHKNILPPLTVIDGRVSQLLLRNQQLNDAKFSLQPKSKSWQLNVDSPQFVGVVDFYPNWLKQGLKIVAQKMYLSLPKLEHDSAEVEHSADMMLPPLAIDVDDFRIDKYQLGHLVFQGTPNDQGYQIQTLSLKQNGVELKGKGMWTHATQNKTNVDFKLKADNFAHLSQILEITPGLQEAPLALNAKLSWQGAPYQFGLEKLNGKVDFDFGKGHLTQVSDQGARIFSLFSLDSLVRKLSLDFSDVFGQGLYFDSFDGNVSIDHGVVKTTDTKMDAIAGEVKVRGYTNLTSQSLNYDISFVPKLASSVPTVVLLSTSAWTFGLGAFALTKVLEPVIEVISEIRFRVTGTMSDPKLEELERKSKEIEIPESILPRKVPASVDDNSAQPKTIPVVEPTQSLKNTVEEVVPAQVTTAMLYSLPKVQPTMPFGDKDECQLTTMSKQPRYQCQSEFYRVAA